MSLDKRNKQIQDFVNSAEYRELTAFYSQSSLFAALGVSRHENTHSNFLAWLLTPSPEKNDHGLGDMALRKLLGALTLVNRPLRRFLDKLPPNFSNAVVSDVYELSDIIVEREKNIGDGRLDIFVGGNIEFDGVTRPLRLAIENKVKSRESDGQTERYQTFLDSHMERPGIYVGIYLTPLANREYELLGAPECDAKDFIQLNYQYLADRVIAPCRDFANSDSIKRYLDEYLLALGLPEIRQNKGDVIMATSKEERDLLARFWGKHKDLLTAAILSMADSDALDEDEHEIVEKAAVAIRAVDKRNKARYAWKFGNEGAQGLVKNRLPLDIVRHYVRNNPGVTLEKLKEAFPDSLQSGDLTAVDSLAYAHPDNWKGYKRYYVDVPIETDSGPIAVSNQWKASNIEKFIAAAQKAGYSVSSTGPDG